jgi:parallel beta-helix repeat protein
MLDASIASTQSPYEMKAIHSSLALFVLLLLCTNFARSANYYFSTKTGDDGRSFNEAQNPATPWKSIKHLNSIFERLQPGDSILFKRGEIFNGGIVISRSGTAANPIVIGAYGSGDRPVINGFVRAQNWTSLGNGIYESGSIAAGTFVNMVVVDDRNYAMGRWPNAYGPNDGYMIYESVGSNSITDKELTSAIDFTGGQLVLRTAIWALEKVTISKHQGSTITYSGSPAYAPSPRFGYFIQNHPKTLDRFGEWYYNPNTRKISVYFGDEKPEDHVVRVAGTGVLANVIGDHIVIDGLTLSGANQYGVLSDDGTRSDNLQVRNSRIEFSGIDGVFMRGRSNFTIEYCEVLNSNSSAIKPLYNNPNTIVRHNYIRNSGMQPGMGHNDDQSYSAVYKGTEGLIAENNVIINSGYIGIRFAGNDNLVKNNYIDTFCSVLDDGAGIYTYGGRSNPTYYNRKIISNVIINGIGAPKGTRWADDHLLAHGIYIDDNATNVEMVGNTMANCTRGVNIHNSRDYVFERNTMFNNEVQMSLINDDYGEEISGGSIRNNKLVSKDFAQPVVYMQSKTKDFADFADYSSNYYARPIYDSLPILMQYKDGSGTLIRQYYELQQWQQDFGEDAGSKKSPLTIPPYVIDSLRGGNQFANSTFDNNTNGIDCFSSQNNCSVSWVSNAIMGGGSIEATGSGDIRVKTNTGSLSSAKQYILRFSAAAKTATSIEVYLRRSSPYEVISERKTVQVGTTKAQYEILFSEVKNESSSRIEFFAGGEKIHFWLDDLELREAEVSMSDPDEFLRFEYHVGDRDTTIKLDAVYMDVTGKVFSGEVVLRPFESVVLIKDPSAKPDQEPNPDTNPDDDTPEEEPNPDDDTNPDDGTNPDEQPNPDEEPGIDPDDPNVNPDNGSGEKPDTNPDENPNNDGTDPDDPGVDPNSGSDASPEDPDVPIGVDPDDNPFPTFPGEENTAGSVGGDINIGDLPGNRTGKRDNGNGSGTRQEGSNSPEIMESRSIDLMDDGAADIPEGRVFPNPVSSWNPELTIEYYAKKNDIQLIILDQMGRIVQILQPISEPGQNIVYYDTSQLASGTYYVHIPPVEGRNKETFPFVVIRN